MLRVEKVRQDFECLKDGKTIYFDNACQSLRPKQVLEAMDEYYKKYPACGERSLHSWGARVTQEVEIARRKIAKFINASPDEIVFTKNTTEGINIVAAGLEWKAGDVVVGDEKAHNSNLLPWMRLRERGVEFRVLSFSPNGLQNQAFDFHDELKKAKLISVTAASQIDGELTDIASIPKRTSALLLVDAAQFIGHHKVDVKKWGADFVAFSGHKMLGPSGTGVLYVKKSVQGILKPLILGGGTASEVSLEIDNPQTPNHSSKVLPQQMEYKLLPFPECFEAGLQNYAGIIGLAAAVDFIEAIGYKNIERQEEEIGRYARKALEALEAAKVLGQNEKSPIISFYFEGIDSHQIALMLSQAGRIAVRSGKFCSHGWFNKYNIPDCVRVSLAFYNTKEEIDTFLGKLYDVLRVLK